MIAIIDLFRRKIILDFQKLYEKMGFDLYIAALQFG